MIRPGIYQELSISRRLSEIRGVCVLLVELNQYENGNGIWDNPKTSYALSCQRKYVGLPLWEDIIS